MEAIKRDVESRLVLKSGCPKRIYYKNAPRIKKCITYLYLLNYRMLV